MKLLQKWNYKNSRYEKYSIPSDWYCPLFLRDMEKIINCASCGKETKHGLCYTSKTIHTDIGLGYSVCDECHKKELEESK